MSRADLHPPIEWRIRHAIALGALLGETDPEVSAGFAYDPEALAWLQGRALEAFSRGPVHLRVSKGSEALQEAALALTHAAWSIVPDAAKPQVARLEQLLGDPYGEPAAKTARARELLGLLAELLRRQPAAPASLPTDSQAQPRRRQPELEL